MKFRKSLFTVIALFLMTGCKHLTIQSPQVTIDPSLLVERPKIAPLKKPAPMGDLLMKANELAIENGQCSMQVHGIITSYKAASGN